MAQIGCAEGACSEGTWRHGGLSAHSAAYPDSREGQTKSS